MKNKFCFFSFTYCWILLTELIFLYLKSDVGLDRLFPVWGTSVIHSPCQTSRSSSQLFAVWIETKQKLCHQAIPALEQPDQQGDSVMTKHLSSFFLTSAFTQNFQNYEYTRQA